MLMYSGGKKIDPDLPIKSTENLNMTCRHSKTFSNNPHRCCVVFMQLVI